MNHVQKIRVLRKGYNKLILKAMPSAWSQCIYDLPFGLSLCECLDLFRYYLLFLQFIADCGKFFKGTAEQMYQSLCVTLGSLPKPTRVYCGHGGNVILKSPLPEFS